MNNNSGAPRLLAYCGLVLIAALYVVGIVSHGILRHIVQTAPVWLIVVAGLRRLSWTKWAALACFPVWLLLMSLIWLFLLGWVRVIQGTFSPTEVAMTVVVGLSSAAAIVTALRNKSGATALKASLLFTATAGLQVAALYVSFLPGIAHD